MHDDIKVFLYSIENNAITPSTPIPVKIDSVRISKIANEVKAGQACGIDDIPNEFLKFEGHTLMTSLIDLFTLISDLETEPDDCQICVIKPLHKSGSMYDLDNYRGITLISNVYKIYSKVLEEAAMTYLEDDAILCEVQRDFRKDRRTEDYIFTLQGLCSVS